MMPRDNNADDDDVVHFMFSASINSKTFYKLVIKVKSILFHSINIGINFEGISTTKKTKGKTLFSISNELKYSSEFYLSILCELLDKTNMKVS